MKNPFRDRIALATTVLGIVLMSLTIAWRVNPIEGSVMPMFLKQTSWGWALFIVLLVTTMPAWIAGVLLAVVIPLVNPSNHSGWVVACCLMLIFQGLLFFGIGKLISICRKRIQNKWTSSNKEQG